MDESKIDLESKQNIIKYKKMKPRAVIFGFFLILGASIFGLSLWGILEILIYGQSEIDISGGFFASAPFLFMAINAFLGYFGNKIIITESFIILRRGALGKTYKIAKSCIIAKQPVYLSYNAFDHCFINFYLKNGEKVSTGYLNCNNKVFNEIDEKFEFTKVKDAKKFKKQLNDLKGNRLRKGDFTIETNDGLLIVHLIPLLLFVVGCL